MIKQQIPRTPSCHCDGVVTASSNDIVKIKENVHITFFKESKI